MKTFDVQSVGINSSFEKAFQYIADVHNLPEWTRAFKSVSDGKALLETHNGSVEIALGVNASRQQGTIDWIMGFPDGSVGTAYSRVVKAENNRCVYSFILLAPPGPLEPLEGKLRQQSQILKEELASLASILNEDSD
jgi:hypothetical protein